MHCQSYPWQGNFRLLLSRCQGPAGSKWGAIFSHLSIPASPAPAASPDWSWQTPLPALADTSQPAISSRPSHLPLNLPPASVLLPYYCSFSTSEHLELTLPPAITQHGSFLCPWLRFRLKSQNPCIKDAPSLACTKDTNSFSQPGSQEASGKHSRALWGSSDTELSMFVKSELKK